MDFFIIGATNFGIEPTKSSFTLTKANDGRLFLAIEVRGNEKLYKEITADENSEWSWTLYPPYFYLRDYSISEKLNGSVCEIRMKPEDSDNFDVALYLMEHNTVTDVTIKFSDRRVEVAGRVDLMGEVREFQIDFIK